MIREGVDQPMDEVRQALDSLNEAWRTRRFDVLDQFFDDDIVMKGPVI